MVGGTHKIHSLFLNELPLLNSLDEGKGECDVSQLNGYAEEMTVKTLYQVEGS